MLPVELVHDRLHGVPLAPRVLHQVHDLPLDPAAVPGGRAASPGGSAASRPAAPGPPVRPQHPVDLVRLLVRQPDTAVDCSVSDVQGSVRLLATQRSLLMVDPRGRGRFRFAPSTPGT